MTTFNRSVPEINVHMPAFAVKDKWSARTHFWGLVGAIIATPILMIRAAGCSMAAQISFALFMLSMILLYGASTSYHAFNIGSKGNLKLKRLDHISIFWLIAGSYAPICIQVLKEDGRLLLACVVGLAVCGTVFKLFWVTCPRYVSSVIYIGMGWACMSVAPQLISAMSTASFGWLLAGGLFYTAGGVIYAIKKPLIRLKGFGNHELFHCFVLAGSLCHYILMAAYLCA